MLVTRKNNEAYSLDVTEDILDAIRWHIRQGYAGPEQTRRLPIAGAS